MAARTASISWARDKSLPCSVSSDSGENRSRRCADLSAILDAFAAGNFDQPTAESFTTSQLSEPPEGPDENLLHEVACIRN